MASSCTPPILSAFTSRRAALYLPVASLAVGLTCLAASFLPAAARSLLPFLDSTFLTFLPHLWNALLRRITPPCLFALLNGIIMILTLSSGVLKTSSAGGSDFCANSSVRKETKMKSSNVELPLKQQPFLKPSVKGQLFDKLNDDLPLQLPLENLSPVEITGFGPATSQFRRIQRSNSVDSAASAEREDHVKDHLASTSSIIVFEVPALDNLSDEALKKKIDDFISKMNAQIRSGSAN